MPCDHKSPSEGSKSFWEAERTSVALCETLETPVAAQQAGRVQERAASVLSVGESGG